MKKDIYLTLSVVSHGNTEKIAHLLSSLIKNERDLSRFQLILTDNLLNDLPDFDPTPWGRFDLIRNQIPLGFAENHNRAFAIADGKYFSILNPDLTFTHPIFDDLITSLHTAHAHMIAPLIVDEHDIPQDSFRSMPTPLELFQRRLPGYTFTPQQPKEDGYIHPDWIAGMFWLMPSETYKMLGGMDKKFRLYLEDVDFCTRARLQGMKIVVDPAFRVVHEAQRSSRSRLKYLFLHIQSAILFFTSSVYRQASKLR